MRNSNYPAAFAVLIALAVVASPVYAGDKEREAMRRMQIMQQQFSDEKAALEQSKDSLTQQVGELTKQTESIKQGTRAIRAPAGSAGQGAGCGADGAGSDPG